MVAGEDTSMHVGAAPADGRAADGPPSSPTMFLPRVDMQSPRTGWTLAPPLRRRITQRLRLIGLAYALSFVFADVLPNALLRQLGAWFTNPARWIPGIGAIVAGLLVARAAASARLSWQAKLHLGLAFEVLGSYGIALAQYMFPPDLRKTPEILHVLSPSWVAVWMIFYSAVVPAPPRKALVALVLSATAPAIVIESSLLAGRLTDLLPFPMLLIHHVLPYAICAVMAYLAARVVYNLGADVSRARELGSYRLVERLGRGGMGEVWSATHQLLARPAAIKFILPEAIAGATPDEAKRTFKRFELEARVTASLTSAHTVDLYDFGITEDGRFYYVMELLDGVNCHDLVRRFGPIPPARIVHVLAQICDSLDEAHTKGMIHRDVKPANVFLCRSGTHYDFAKVLDFGLVMHRHVREPLETRLTLPHQAVGTPQFMAPEVANGRAADGRADLYAVGCVGYWLATGHLVFGGATPYEVISHHLHTAPTPPSQRASHPLPPELDAVILSCLAKQPDQRPASARALGGMLRAIPLAAPWDDEAAKGWWESVGLSQPRPVGPPPAESSSALSIPSGIWQ